MQLRGAGRRVVDLGGGAGEAGDTLVELMITVAILGVSMVAILGGIWATLARPTTTPKLERRHRAACLRRDHEGGQPHRHLPLRAVHDGRWRGRTYPAYAPSAPYDHYTATITKIRYVTGTRANEPVWSDSAPRATAGSRSSRSR